MAPLGSEGLSIYSTDLYQGLNIPIFGIRSIDWISRAGGDAPAALHCFDFAQSLPPQPISNTTNEEHLVVVLRVRAECHFTPECKMSLTGESSMSFYAGQQSVILRPASSYHFL